jgi:hypothetical protein
MFGALMDLRVIAYLLHAGADAARELEDAPLHAALANMRDEAIYLRIAQERDGVLRDVETWFRDTRPDPGPDVPAAPVTIRGDL